MSTAEIRAFSGRHQIFDNQETLLPFHRPQLRGACNRLPSRLVEHFRVVMAFKKLMRSVLDNTRNSASYECGFDDDEDEVVQQRLRIPGAPGYSKVRRASEPEHAVVNVARARHSPDTIAHPT